MYLPTLTVREARLQYLQANGLPEDGGESANWVYVQIGPIPIVFPNFKSRKKTLLRHDLHHVANDCDTSFKGEGLVAAWELGRGYGRLWFGWWIQTQALWWGILLCPKQAFYRFRQGKHGKNFYHDSDPKLWMDKTVQEMRTFLLPRETLPPARVSDYVEFIAYAWLGQLMMALSLPLFLFPIAIAIAWLIWTS